MGDSAYPCLPNLITPYKDTGNLTAAQKRFNKTLSQCRVVIEDTFGILKQRFRMLYHMKLRDIGRVVKIIYACCVLHNLSRSDDLNYMDGPRDDTYCDPSLRNVRIVVPGSTENESTTTGREIRDELCRQVTANRNH